MTSGGTTEAWSYFLTRWKTYIRAVALDGQDRVAQLLECCDDKLRRDMTRNTVGSHIEDLNEEEVLATMRSLAVTEENPKVARAALAKMYQDRGEPIRAYAARLRGQAEVCMFTKTCAGATCTVVNNQGEERVADQLCIGLVDDDIREDLLKDPNQGMTVEQTVRFMEVRAAGKRSAVTIATHPSHQDAVDESQAISSHRRRQYNNQGPGTTTPSHNQGPGITTPSHPRTTPHGPYHSHQRANHTPRANHGQPPQRRQTRAERGQPGDTTPCSFCGQFGHGEHERTAIRRQKCPAFGTVCTNCKRANHSPKMCWGTEHENAIFEDLDEDLDEMTLDHQSWDSTEKSWTSKRSPPQPILNLSVGPTSPTTESN